MRDGERTIRFGEGAAAEAPDLLAQSGFGKYALLTTERAEGSAPLDEPATQVVHVPPGLVDEISATLLGDLMEVPLVALGGGRVIDTAKAIGGVTGLPVAAIPTTLSGAELTPFHRTPAGVEGAHMVRPSLVVADPLLMASQPRYRAGGQRDERARARDGGALHAARQPRGRARRPARRGTDRLGRAGARRIPVRMGLGDDWLRRASRHLPAPGAHGRLAACADERGDAAALRPHDGRAGPGRDRRVRAAPSETRTATRRQPPAAPRSSRRAAATPASPRSAWRRSTCRLWQRR